LADLNKAKFNQETLLRQKARTKWIMQEDLNSKYFTKIINWRRTLNKINGLMDNGEWCDNPQRTKDKVKKFFTNRFSQREGLKVRLENIQFTKISPKDNVMLMDAISEKKIREAI